MSGTPTNGTTATPPLGDGVYPVERFQYRPPTADGTNTLPAIDIDRATAAIEELLKAVGEDPTREGLQKTPARVAKAYKELLAGYRTDPDKLINGALFPANHSDLVVVRKIEYHSLCEHHLLPFYGYATVAYLPAEKIIGLSKIPRVVDLFARRLQIQERLTRQIAEFLDDVLAPSGIAVALDGVHMCANMRGVRKHEARMTTTCVLGAFETDRALRSEFLTLARAS